MDLTPFLRPFKDYASYELMGVALVVLRTLFKRTTSDNPQAADNGDMMLTPDGWITDKKRLSSSSPIQPR
jgi:hypothetical protein